MTDNPFRKPYVDDPPEKLGRDLAERHLRETVGKMTEKHIEAIRARRAAITPDEWYTDQGEFEPELFDTDDLVFTAHAPADIDWLLTQNDKLEAALGQIANKGEVETTAHDKTYIRGFNAATSECRQIAHRALKGVER